MEWNLGVVDSQAVALAADSTTADTLAGALKSDSERNLESMSGHTIDTAREQTGKLVTRAFGLSDDLESASDILSTFAANASVQQSRLRVEVEAATRANCTVSEDGTVTPHEGASDSQDAEYDDIELAIKNALKALTDLDTDASTKLSDLHGSIADFSNNSDPRTVITGGIVDGHTTALAELLKNNDDGLRSTKLVAKGLGPFGNLLGFAAGVGGAPDDEPMSETLAAEGGGLAAGILGSALGGAATGAAVGSVFPGVGTAAGAIGGIVIGGFASLWASSEIRDNFDRQRDGS